MSQILSDYSVKQINTFGIDVHSKFYFKFNHVHQLTKLFSKSSPVKDFLVVGKGSNLLFTKDYDGFILQSGVNEVFIKSKLGSEIIVSAAAGLEWDEFIAWCVKKGFWGLENLSYIPGTVGAAPVQNIGAYGVEVSECIESVTYFNPKTLSISVINKLDCKFGYRDSIFKNELNKVIVLSVNFKLSKNPHRRLQYNDIQSFIEKNSISQPLTLDDVRRVIISIRKGKLPDPEKIGNGGSFFKNPVISNIHFEKLNTLWNDMPYYKLPSGDFKIPAAWLIDKAGWKGFRVGDAGVHIDQPLVLVNYGNASGLDILNLSEDIVQSIRNKFGVTLEKEIIVL